ncbi:MAG: AAA family ATPase, partial [Thermoplasmata archaeon]
MAARESVSGSRRPFVGRGEVRTAIGEALSSAQAGRGSLLVLVGEEGVGKSTILSYASEQAQAEGFRVGTTRATPTEFPRPFAAVQEMLHGFGDSSGGSDRTSEPDEVFSLLLAPLERRESAGV